MMLTNTIIYLFPKSWEINMRVRGGNFSHMLFCHLEIAVADIWVYFLPAFMYVMLTYMHILISNMNLDSNYAYNLAP